MARLFDDASAHHLRSSTTPVTVTPFSVCLWFRCDDATITQTVFSIGSTANDTNYFLLAAAGATVGDPIEFHGRAGGASSIAFTTTGFSVNTWHHVAMVSASATDRRVFIDGGSKGIDTVSRVPTGLNALAVGRLERLTPGSYFSGRIERIPLYNVALTDAEVLALAKGGSPFRVCPGGLVRFWPVWGDHSPEINLVSADGALTVTGATKADGAPVRPYSSKWWGTQPIIELFPAQTLTVAAADAALTAIAATLTPGAAMLTATAAQTALQAVTAALSAGAVTVLLTPAEATVLAGIGILQAGVVTLSPTAAQAALSAVTATLERGGPAIQYRARFEDVNEYGLRIES